MNQEQRWSYHVLTLHNPELPSLPKRLHALGEDGWELVAFTSTDKVVAIIGNHLVFVFKKPGGGHVYRGEDGDQFTSETPW